MSKFSSLLGYLKPKNTVWHTLERVHIPPNNPAPVRIEIQSSGRINADYTSAVLRLNKEREQEGAAGTSAGLEASDARQLKLFAKHVVVGWDEVKDEQMQSMPFNARDIEDLLLAISIDQKSPDIVAGLIYRAADQNNFREQPLGSPEALGKR